MYTTNPKISNQLSIWLISMFWIVSFMIIVGGLTRLTDSGLSITEWELFSGLFPPLNHNDLIVYFNLYKQIPEFKLKRWVEFKYNSKQKFLSVNGIDGNGSPYDLFKSVKIDGKVANTAPISGKSTNVTLKF